MPKPPPGPPRPCPRPCPRCRCCAEAETTSKRATPRTNTILLILRILTPPLTSKCWHLQTGYMPVRTEVPVQPKSLISFLHRMRDPTAQEFALLARARSANAGASAAGHYEDINPGHAIASRNDLQVSDDCDKDHDSLDGVGYRPLN